MKNIQDRFARSRIIFQDDFAKLQNASVVVFGLGGVGGACVDCLYRSGVGKICVVDHDRFDITNQNRQFYSQFVGESKASVFQRECDGIKGICVRVDSDFLDNFDLDRYEYVLDCIDDIPAKIEIAKRCQNRIYGRYIVATGSAKKLNPLDIKVGDLFKSYGDKFAKKLRDELKKQKIYYKIKSVFSDEDPKCKELGSFSGVTASFGLVMASEVIKDILQKE